MKAVVLFQKAILVIIFSFLISLSSSNKILNREKLIYVIFRYDDYSEQSPIDIEKKIIDAFRKIESPVTFAVVPFVVAKDAHNPLPQDIIPLSHEKGDILKAGLKDGVLDIALHGYSHQTDNPNEFTEFSGDYESQIDKIKKGKSFLESVINYPVTTFVPPWNSYDFVTLQVLEKLGFTTLSADRNGGAFQNSRLYFLPATAQLSALKKTIKAARVSPDAQPTIVVLLHAYDFTEVDKKQGFLTHQEFLDLLTWLKSQSDVRILSISQASKSINDLSVNRILSNKRYYSLAKLIPTALRTETGTIYQEPHFLQRLFIEIGAFYITLFLLCTLISYAIGSFVFPKSQLVRNISTFGSLVSSLLIIFIAFHNLNVGFKGLVITVCNIGIASGFSLCFIRFNRKYQLKNQANKNIMLSESKQTW